MTGLLDTTNAPRSVQRKSLPTCTLSLASVSAHKHQLAVDLPQIQSSVIPFPSGGVGGRGAHALLRSSSVPPPIRVRISTSVTSPSPPSIRRKRSASRLTSPRPNAPLTPTTPPRKRARTSSSKSVSKTPNTTIQTPRRAPSADIKLNACVYRTIFTLGWTRHATVANAAAKRRSSRCMSPTPGSTSSSSHPRFDDSDDSDLDSEIEEELEIALHHAILEEQDIMLSLKLRCYLLRNGVDPRSVFFERQEEEGEAEERSVPDPFLKDPGPQPDSELDRMDVEVEASTPSVPSSSTPISVPVSSRDAPPPPCRSTSPPRPAPLSQHQTPTRPRQTSTSPPPSPPISPPKLTLKPAPPLLPPSHLTARLLLRHASRKRNRYRSIRARDGALELEVENLFGKAKGNGLAMGRRSPLKSVFSEADVRTSLSEELVSQNDQGSVLEDVLMGMMVEEPDGAHVVQGAQRTEDAPMDIDA